MDELDRRLLNLLQRDIPLCESPFEEAASALEISEDEVVDRVRHLLDEGLLTRFGPMYAADRMGGHITLAAMHVPRWDFERVVAVLNDLPEVAHNYEREHYLNMWFVVASDDAQAVTRTLQTIENMTKYKVYDFPKQEEYYLNLYLPV